VHVWPHREGVGVGIVEGGPRGGVATPAVVVGAAVAVALALTLAFVIIVWGGAGGEGSPEDSTAVAKVGVVTVVVPTMGTLLLRAWSRT
jgi:hypothetical protein